MEEMRKRERKRAREFRGKVTHLHTKSSVKEENRMLLEHPNSVCDDDDDADATGVEEPCIKFSHLSHVIERKKHSD